MEDKTKKQDESKLLNIADVMHRFYQQIAKEHEVHIDRIMLAITDNGRFFQAYVTNEQETELRYLQDYVITNNIQLFVNQSETNGRQKHKP